MLESHEITRLESDKPPRGKSFSGLCRSAFGPQLRDPHATYAPSTDNLNALSSQGAYGHPLGGADYSFDSLSVNVSVQGLGMGLDGVVSDMGSSSPKSTERKAHHALRSHIENARSLHISDKLSSIGAAITVAAGGLLEASRSKYELKSKQEEESRKSPPQSWKSPEEPRRSHEESRRSHEESRRSHEESRRSHEESRRSHEESWRSHEESRRSQEGSMHRAQNPPDAAARLPLVLDAEVEQLVKELDDMADTQIQEHSAIQKRLKQKQTEYIDKQREMCTQLQEDQKTFWAGLANKWASQASAVALKGAEAEQTGLEQICKSLKDAGLSLAVEALLSGTSLAAAPGLAISKAGEASATSDESGPKHPPVNAEKEQDVKAEADARPPDETKPEGKPDDGPAPPYGRRGSSSYMDNGPTREASTSSPVQSPMAYRVRIKDDRGSVRARGDPNGLRPRPAPSDDGRAPSPKNSDSPPPVDRKMVRRGSVTQDPKNNITFKKVCGVYFLCLGHPEFARSRRFEACPRLPFPAVKGHRVPTVLQEGPVIGTVRIPRSPPPKLTLHIWCGTPSASLRKLSPQQERPYTNNSDLLRRSGIAVVSGVVIGRGGGCSARGLPVTSIPPPHER